ncbi:MAG: Fe-S cluster assembly protein SufD [Deltaproteobacteria bacterium]|nr:Fe-S cluster assembly protein SufD [Deltaproteobacteria bacterium]
MTSFDANHIRGWAEGREVSEKSPAWLKEERTDALEAFCAVGLPSTKEEAFRKTSLKPLATTKLRAPALNAVHTLPEEHLGEHLSLLIDAGKLVSQRWFHSSGDVVKEAPTGVSLFSLADIPEDMRALLGSVAKEKESALTQLNAALFEDVLVIVVEESANATICITHLQEKANENEVPFSLARVLVLVKAEANLELVEVDAPGVSSFVASRVLEAKVEQGASFTHTLLSDLQKNQDMLREIHVDIDKKATFNSFALPCGGRIHRTELAIHLRGEEANATSFGAIVADDKALVDVHSLIHHHVGHCKSEQEIRGILAEKGHGIFNGHVIFEKNAQLSDTAQKNPNLLLSRDAIIDTQPVLEIYADDVKASHGSTVGQLDADAYFYLRSRGLDEDEAYHLLVQAFAQDVLHFASNDDVRKLLEGTIRSRLDSIIARADAAAAEAT